MLSGQRDPQMIVAAMQAGASDYLCKPVAVDELVAVIEKNVRNKEVKERYDALIEDMNESLETQNFIGSSKTFKGVLDQAKQLRGYEANVLIEGESGTGKELLAKFIHRNEGNSKRPFIAVNCAAIPDTLIESELFGHEQGAFTTAIKRKIGKFELANGGDIFLDEINSLKPELQAKLLRILQEKEFYRVGGTQPLQVKFRVISASNVNLSDEVGRGRFRQDLLYRLRVVSLTMPPLRERVEDIEELSFYFLRKHCRPNQLKTLSADVMDQFKKYNWPGNIRELENLIQSLIIMSKTTEIQSTDLPNAVNAAFVTKQNLTPTSTEHVSSASALSLKEALESVEKELIRKMIAAQNGNVTLAARALKISRSKVYYTLKERELN
jgi:DNA-binding NtrC family response regulator